MRTAHHLCDNDLRAHCTPFDPVNDLCVAYPYAREPPTPRQKANRPRMSAEATSALLRLLPKPAIAPEKRELASQRNCSKAMGLRRARTTGQCRIGHRRTAKKERCEERKGPCSLSFIAPPCRKRSKRRVRNAHRLCHNNPRARCAPYYSMKSFCTALTCTRFHCLDNCPKHCVFIGSPADCLHNEVCAQHAHEWKNARRHTERPCASALMLYLCAN